VRAVDTQEHGDERCGVRIREQETRMIDPTHLRDLCCELRVLLEAEIAAGNRVAETSKGWPLPDSVWVLLSAPFHNTPEQLPPGVKLVDVNDPHWWKQEYKHLASGSVLACQYTNHFEFA
jgi:hypothetical protein